MSVEFEVVSDVLTGIIDRVAKSGADTTIGVHEDAEPYPDGTAVATVYAAQEFGTPTNPSRPTLRAYYDGDGKRELGDAAAFALGAIVDGEAPAAMGEAIGAVGVEGVRDRIERGSFTPLRESTLRNPKRDPGGIALNDTGRLRDSIDAKTGGR